MDIDVIAPVAGAWYLQESLSPAGVLLVAEPICVFPNVAVVALTAGCAAMAVKANDSISREISKTFALVFL
jgi:hypothetical protein